MSALKRMMAALLALVLVMGLTPVTVFAAQNKNVITLTPETEFEVMAMEEYSFLNSANSYNPPLACGNFADWIDRLDNLPEYATEFYHWMEENTDNDGTQDAMIDVTTADFTGYGLMHSVVDFSGTVGFEVPEGSDNAVIEQAGKAAIKAETDALKAEARAMMVAVDNAFDRDHPEVFWLGKGAQTVSSLGTEISNDGSGWEIRYELKLFYALQLSNFDVRAEKYQDVSALKAAIAQRDSTVSTILSGMPSEATMYDKVQYFNKWLTKNNCYNTSADLNNIGVDCRNCMSALVGSTGTEGPVCEGYARAMKVLCDTVGIPCVLVSGTSDGEPHMWNYIRQDDLKWYAVDTTWNDPSVDGVTGKVSGYENEDYLLVGGNTVVDGVTFLESHTMTNEVSNGGVAFTNGPVLEDTAYTPGGIGAQPTEPTTAPTTEPTTAPTTEPTTAPTTEPTTAPTTEPTTAPTTEPTTEPTTAPTTEPTTAPTTEPTTAPTTEPTTAPTTEPTTAPTTEPTTAPTTEPTTAPTTEPTTAPTTEPTTAPTTEPTTAPTTEPTTAPTTEPTTAPTTEPTTEPTTAPTEPEPTEPEKQLPSVAGQWETDFVFAAADLGVSAPDSVLRCYLTFGEDGSASTQWKAIDLTAIREYFHTMFVNAYYACAYGAGITSFEEVEQFCMESTGMGVSDYMYSFLDSYDMNALFTPASTTGLYTYNDDHTAIYTDLVIMGNASDAAVANAFTLEDGILYLNAASYGKPEYTFVCKGEGSTSAPETPELDDSLETQYEQEVIRLVNDIRVGYGLDTLEYDKALGDVARIKSQDMLEAGYFEHNSPTYGTPFEMMEQFGLSFRSAGENIAMGHRSPEEVVNGWMNSDGHRANILNDSFTHIGVGFEPNGNYWTQMFIGK